MNLNNITFLTVIIAFFVSVVVSYYTVYRIDQRYEFAIDRPKSFSRYKSFYAVISFAAAFILTLVISVIF